MTGFNVYYCENVKSEYPFESMIVIIAKTEEEALASVAENYPDVILSKLKFKIYPIKEEGIAMRISVGGN